MLLAALQEGLVLTQAQHDVGALDVALGGALAYVNTFAADPA